MIVSALRDWLGDRAAARLAGRERLVVAVSGGADSSALALALTDAGRALGLPVSDTFVLAHFDHCTRPRTEHERDLRTVRSIARRAGVPLVIGQAATGAVEADAAASGGPEAAARRMRYDFLRRICRAVGAARVCTAHTADDQSETVMMRLLSGIEGTLIAGIPRTRDLGCGVTVERPLLDFRRQQIESYLEQRSASWSDDRTNVELRYRRNLVRRQVLPEVERFWPAVRSDLVALARAMAAYRERVEAEAAELRPTVTDDEALVDRDAFFTLSEDARLELLYSLLERLELFGRRDRPSHRFFAPLLGADPGVDRRLVGARGIDISLRGAELVVSARVVRSPESRYLR